MSHDIFAGLPEATPTRIRRRRKRKWWRRATFRRRLRLSLLLLGAVTLLGGVQLGWAIWNLRTAGNEVAQARVMLGTGEVAQAESLVAKAHVSARRADLGSRGPHLALLESVPFVGDDIRAVRTVASVSNAATGPVATDMFAMRDALDPNLIRPVHGQVDLRLFVQAGQHFGDLAGKLEGLDDRLQDLPLEPVAGPLREPLQTVVDELHTLRTTADYGNQVLDMVPAALGADGPRRYLVAFQNNAELRTTGGIPGSFAVLQANKGKLEMLDTGTGARFQRDFRKPVLPSTPEEELLFDGQPARWVQDVNLTPDWPRSAELINAMWRETSSLKIDGIISVDPVALSYVLRGSGPIALPYGKVATAGNAVQTLLNQPYLELATQQLQNDFFEESSTRIFKALITGDGSAGTSLRGLFDAVREGRGYVWMTKPDEQAKVVGSVVDGLIPRVANARPDIGFYINDATSTKLEYYVTSKTDVRRESCSTDGSQTLTMTTTLHNGAPAVTGPYWLVGPRVSDTPGDVLLTVMAYGPIGSSILDPTIDGRPGDLGRYQHLGHPVAARTVLLPRGKSMQLRWTVKTGPGQSGIPVFRTTPGAQSSGIGTMVDSSCPKRD